MSGWFCAVVFGQIFFFYRLLLLLLLLHKNNNKQKNSIINNNNINSSHNSKNSPILTPTHSVALTIERIECCFHSRNSNFCFSSVCSFSCCHSIFICVALNAMFMLAVFLLVLFSSVMSAEFISASNQMAQ